MKTHRFFPVAAISAAVVLLTSSSVKADILFDWVSTAGDAATGQIDMNNSLTLILSGTFTPTGLSPETLNPIY